MADSLFNQYDDVEIPLNTAIMGLLYPGECHGLISFPKKAIDFRIKKSFHSKENAFSFPNIY
jgi:hypothetical protein